MGYCMLSVELLLEILDTFPETDWPLEPLPDFPLLKTELDSAFGVCVAFRREIVVNFIGFIHNSSSSQTCSYTRHVPFMANDISPNLNGIEKISSKLRSCKKKPSKERYINSEEQKKPAKR
ncbi:hypothetical protein PIB30_056095 [Stylosanthes scabra]|uniref:Uncharacterized protein n=1 Tax=Stylosanthes scabra TaxID=79078 RepID=A0ABU6VK92_9FABA|nr:hypothetical protein [Stylosanthes scabra]